MQTSENVLVPKEQVRHFHFQSAEVLSNEQEIIQRRNDLYKAMILGNSNTSKVKISFETQEGKRAVETTVWFAADSFIVLKGHVTIPIHCIRKVEF
jgi:hypothetical protein